MTDGECGAGQTERAVAQAGDVHLPGDRAGALGRAPDPGGRDLHLRLVTTTIWRRAGAAVSGARKLGMAALWLCHRDAYRAGRAAARPPRPREVLVDRCP